MYQSNRSFNIPPRPPHPPRQPPGVWIFGKYLFTYNWRASLLAEFSHNKAKWNERRETSAGFRRVSYHACAHVSLITSDVFVTFDTTQRTGLNLSVSMSGCWIWACTQILNGPIRVEDETTLWAAIVVDPKSPRKAEEVNFSFFTSLSTHTYLEWNFLGFMELLVLLQFGTILFEEKAICGVTSGQRWMEWFPCQQL